MTDYISKIRAQKEFGFSKPFLYKLIKENGLQVHPLRRKRYLKRSEIEALIDPQSAIKHLKAQSEQQTSTIETLIVAKLKSIFNNVEGCQCKQGLLTALEKSVYNNQNFKL